MTTAANKGIVDKPSNHSVEQTVDRLKNILQSKAVTLFALIDHSGEAEKVGMKMPPTKLLIFGNPKAGTPLMLAAPSSARPGLVTTVHHTCKSDTACRRNCCKTSL
jgi:uncharacterized protein (DUF302 family)